MLFITIQWELPQLMNLVQSLILTHQSMDKIILKGGIELFNDFPKIIIILFFLFIFSLIIVVICEFCKKKRKKEIKNTILMDGYMKLYLHIKNGHGELDVIRVDEMQPLYSNEVINKAIFLSPGEHKLELTGKVKDNGIAMSILPYYTNLGDFEVIVFAKKNAVAILNYDVITQNIFIEEGERPENGTI